MFTFDLTLKDSVGNSCPLDIVYWEVKKINDNWYFNDLECEFKNTNSYLEAQNNFYIPHVKGRTVKDHIVYSLKCYESAKVSYRIFRSW